MAAQSDRILASNRDQFQGSQDHEGGRPLSGTAVPQRGEAEVEQRVLRGSNWFLWIAGLSAVNTVVSFTGSSWRFIVGLGATQIVDAVGGQLGGAGRVLAVLADGVAIGLFLLLWHFARREHGWAYVVGMAVVALDMVLAFLIRDFISGAFHVYVLYSIYRGYRGLAELRASRMGHTDSDHPIAA